MNIMQEQMSISFQALQTTMTSLQNDVTNVCNDLKNLNAIQQSSMQQLMAYETNMAHNEVVPEEPLLFDDIDDEYTVPLLPPLESPTIQHTTPTPTLQHIAPILTYREQLLLPLESTPTSIFTQQHTSNVRAGIMSEEKIIILRGYLTRHSNSFPPVQEVVNMIEESYKRQLLAVRLVNSCFTKQELKETWYEDSTHERKPLDPARLNTVQDICFPAFPENLNLQPKAWAQIMTHVKSRCRVARHRKNKCTSQQP